ncbi:hypothetical protein MSG28_009509 [Choristoneura fumiferana]|uniref:Uncharacterized protein n=2 Tax=Choristoneura fumiferana TaxID=7141 RepID=A0ACC0JBJ1_CHOFU|nr:hypothetical protein MSG28_009509 [Choristoneura fumiferana]
MQEQQQENAQTVKELVDEARDITEQFYKAQMRSMEEKYEAEISELREEYEVQLNKKSDEDGTPSRSLQKKIIHLMQQVAILEEELSAERLARARMEQEMQHLRACIEERDEKASDNSNDEDAIDVTDSEDESDEVDDICNESLEPTFKKEDINRSRLIRQSTLNNTHNSTCDMNKTEDTVKDDSLTDLTDKRESTMTVDQSDETYEKSDETYDVSNNDSCNNHSIDCPDTVKKAHINSDLKLSSEIGRGTYFVDSKVELKPNARDTYFVNDSKISITADVDKGDSSKKNDTNVSRDTGINESLEDYNTGEIKDKNTSVSVAQPVKSIETHIDKIKKFAKTTASSDSSLTQFELLEMEANDFGKHEKTAKYFDDGKTVADIVSPRKLKEKKPYFDNISPSIKVDILKDFSKKHDVLRSPSIVQDEVPDNYKPTTINKILRESFSKNVELPPAYNKSRILLRNHDSIDIFEEVESPCPKQDLLKSVEMARQSIEKIALDVVKENEGKSQSNEAITEEKVKIEAESESVESVKHDDAPTYDDEKEPETYNSSNNHKMLLEKDVHIKREILSEIKKTRNSIAKQNNSAEITNQGFTSKMENSDEIKPELFVPPKEVTVDTEMRKQGSKSEMDKEITKCEISKTKECHDINAGIDVQVAKEEIDTKIKVKQERISTTGTGIVEIEEQSKIETEEPLSLTNSNQTSTDNTIDAFENIYKDITAPRATDFELLVTDNTQEISNEKNDKTEAEPTTQDNKTDEAINNLNDSVEENTAKAVKYNLRHKKENSEIDNEILVENTAKCSRTVKKSLRLRRQKNKVEEDDKDTMKNIITLQKEFSDVTLDVPAPAKDVKDIPSPEQSESENLPPLMGAQSCPSKSVTRSRRKLFTPRPEPLDESPAQPGDSNERIRVPRPSYHRTRTRRRLN